MVKTSLKIDSESKAFMEKMALSQKHVKRYKRTFTIIFLVLATLEFVLFLTSHVFFDLICGFIFILFAFVLIPLTLKIKLKNSYKRLGPDYFKEERFYEFNEEGIYLKTSKSEGLTKWSGFKNYGITEKYIWIRRIDNALILVDRSKLTTEEDAEVIGYLKNIEVTE